MNIPETFRSIALRCKYCGHLDFGKGCKCDPSMTLADMRRMDAEFEAAFRKTKPLKLRILNP